MSNNLNVKSVNTTSPLSFFKLWLQFLKPFHKLRNKEMDLIALFLYKRQSLKSKINDDELLDKMLFSKDIKDSISDKMGFTTSQTLTNMLSILRKKGIITDNKFLKGLVPNLDIDSENFKLILDFNIKNDDTGQTTKENN